MLLEMRCKIVDINETAVEKTAPEKELPDEMQSETITGIADAQKTFNDSTDSFTRFKVCCIDGKHIAIIEMNTADEYVFCRYEFSVCTPFKNIDSKMTKQIRKDSLRQFLIQFKKEWYTVSTTD